jgi:hypothetical protein
MSYWTVAFSKDAKKQYKKLERSGSKILNVIDFLALDLQKNGPHLPLWPHFEVYYVGSHENAPY